MAPDGPLHAALSVDTSATESVWRTPQDLLGGHSWDPWRRLSARTRLARRSWRGSSRWLLPVTIAVSLLLELRTLSSSSTSAALVPIVAAPSWQTGLNVPLLIAAVLFSSLSVSVAVVLGLLVIMHASLDQWSLRIRTGLAAHLYICCSGAVFYSLEWVMTSHLLVTLEDGGHHMLTRNLHWLTSTPFQLYIYVLVFAVPEMKHSMVPVYASCILMQLFGVLMLVTPYPRTCTVISCLFFVLVFLLLSRLPLLPETRTLARKIMAWMVFLWGCYPVTQFAAYTGWMSRHIEQVYVYTLLDCTAKCLTLGSILLARIARTLASIEGALQLVMASHELVLVVDASFKLLEAARDLPQLSSYFGSDDDRDLLELCATEEHKEMLRQAARNADVQQFGEQAPKCVVVLKLKGNLGEVLTECYMSKLVQGRRTVGIVVQSVSGFKNLEDLGSGIADIDIDVGSSVSERIEAAGGIPFTELSLELALHNCATVLELAPRSFKEVRKVFLEYPAIPTALFFYEATTQSELTVVAVSSAFVSALGAFLPNPATPCPLGRLLSSGDISSLLMAIESEDLVVYTLEGAQLPRGARADVTVLPLNRLSRAASSSEVRIGVLLLENIIGRAPKEVPRQHSFWYFAGKQLLRLTTGLNRSVAPPQQVRAPAGMQSPNCWHVFITLPCRNSHWEDPDLGDAPIELVVKGDGSESKGSRDPGHQELAPDALWGLLQAPQGPRPEHQVPPPTILRALVQPSPR